MRLIPVSTKRAHSMVATGNPPLRCGHVEADLIVWESGEGELSLLQKDGQVELQHLEHLTDVELLDGVLRRVLRTLSLE
jgi:hypothetical protein